MNLSNWLAGIMPSIAKGQILSDIDNTRTELKNQTLPPLRSMADNYGKRKFSDAWVREIDAMMTRRIEYRYQGNFVNASVVALENAVKILDVVERIVTNDFVEDTMRDAMSLIRANTLQFMDTISFATRYTRRLMLAAIALEVATVDKGDSADHINLGEIRWLKQHLEDYCTALNILNLPVPELERRMRELPDVSVNPENVHRLQAVVGISKVDPFKFGLLPTRINFIYGIRIAFAEYQVKRLKAAESERQMLEFKLLELENALDGKNDAALEKRIRVTRERISQLNYQLMEAEVG